MTDAPRHVAICTPLRAAQVHCDYTRSLIGTQNALRERGIAWSWQVVTAGANVPRMRNLCVAKALAAGATDVFFIDADIGWRPQDFMRLLDHPQPFVAGAYPRRGPQPDQPRFTIKPVGGERQALVDGLVECDVVATGFLRLKRSVFDALAPTAPRFVNGDVTEAECAHLRGYFSYRYRPVGEQDGEVYHEDEGEDVYFCHRWREIGGQVWADPFARLRHHDDQHTLDACLGDYLVDADNQQAAE